MDEKRKNLPLILASSSPRRRELLGLLGMPFRVMDPDGEETVTDTDPAKVTETLSRQKAQAVAEKITDGIVIGADTVVAVDGKILGKPTGPREAEGMIDSLQGRAHMVYTGVTVLWKAPDSRTVTRTFSVGTKVYVAAMSPNEIAGYVAGGDCMDKAGAYGIQGEFSCFIEGIEGDYFNVVGLPVHRLYEELKGIPG